MAFAKGRNNMQAYIEDSLEQMRSLVNILHSFFSDKIERKKNKVKSLIEDCKNEDVDVVESMVEYHKEEIAFWEDFFKETLESLLIKIYSIAEFCMEQILLKRIGYKRKDALKEYKQDQQPKENVSDIEKYFYVLKKSKNLTIERITDLWTDYASFHEKGKNIVHTKDSEKNIDVNIDYIMSNINQIAKLLNVLEKETRS
jgi:hypothetical protein